MDKPKQADVVTIQEAIEKIKKWLQEKDYKKAKQGCEEILAVEKDNAEAQKLLEEAKKELGESASKNQTKNEDMPTPTPAKAPSMEPSSTQKKPEEKKKETTKKPKKAPTPESIMAKSSSVEGKDQPSHPKKPSKHSSPIGKIILIILILGFIGGSVFAFLQGWLNPAFDWLLNILGL